MSGAFSLIGCESRRPGGGVAEKHLRDRVVVVGNGVRALWDESMAVRRRGRRSQPRNAGLVLSLAVLRTGMWSQPASSPEVVHRPQALCHRSLRALWLRQDSGVTTARVCLKGAARTRGLRSAIGPGHKRPELGDLRAALCLADAAAGHSESATCADCS
jgi:hypothetical protein